MSQLSSVRGFTNNIFESYLRFATPCTYLIIFVLLIRVIFGEMYRLWYFSLCNFLLSLTLAVYKCSSQHPVLRYPQTMFKFSIIDEVSCQRSQVQMKYSSRSFSWTIGLLWCLDPWLFPSQAEEDMLATYDRKYDFQLLFYYSDIHNTDYWNPFLGVCLYRTVYRVITSE